MTLAAVSLAVAVFAVMVLARPIGAVFGLVPVGEIDGTPNVLQHLRAGA